MTKKQTLKIYRRVVAANGSRFCSYTLLSVVYELNDDPHRLFIDGRTFVIGSSMFPDGSYLLVVSSDDSDFSVSTVFTKK